ncbi:MAG TPA: O-antigen ligase [Coleofasciculaceae cyanobacterium]
MRCASYYNASEGSGLSGGYVTSPLDRPILLMQFGIYTVTLLLVILRFKSVIRPAMRDPFLWVLTLMVLTSFVWSDFPSISQKYGIRVFFTTLFGLYLASRFSMKEQFRMVAWALGFATVFSLLYTLALPGAGIESGIHSGAWRGPVLHKNSFARIMVVSALSSLLVAINSRKYRFILWTVFAIAVALLVLSRSKTALLIFINVMALFPFYRALRWSHGITVPFWITLLLIGGSLLNWLSGDWENVLVGLGKDSTLSGRTEIWNAVIEQIWKRPWFGYGYQAFWQDEGGAELVWITIRYRVAQAHNGFLNIGAELGLLGLACFVLSIIFTFIRAIKWARLTKTADSLWPILYVTFLPMYNYTETTAVEDNSIFWILLVAISLSLKRLPDSNPAQEQEDLHQVSLV